jgi:1,4-dihydroxy-2-naphthoyl-CoA hydrolase
MGSTIFRPEITTEVFNGRSRDHLPGLVGIRALAVASEGLESRLEVRKDLMAPNVFLHAATVIALADTGCGCGTVANLPHDTAGVTTIELKANFPGTLRDGAIFCRATPVHLGRTTHVWDAIVTDDPSGGRSRISAALG